MHSTEVWRSEELLNPRDTARRGSVQWYDTAEFLTDSLARARTGGRRSKRNLLSEGKTSNETRTDFRQPPLLRVCLYSVPLGNERRNVSARCCVG
jgi:hypothetical protein